MTMVELAIEVVGWVGALLILLLMCCCRRAS